MPAAQSSGDADPEGDGLGAAAPEPAPRDNIFVTRGLDADTWHLWNTSDSLLVLSKDEVARCHVVRAGMEQTSIYHLRIIREIAVPGLQDRLCAVGSDIQPCEPLDAACAAADSELVRVCTAKGIKCAIFLESYVKSTCDEELNLGKRMYSLCVSVIQEMMGRKYDIMHHYPLFNRMIDIHYSDTAVTEPPSLEDAIRPGGLLDETVREHESLHKLSVVGSDSLNFTRWNQPYVKPDEAPCDEEDSAPAPESGQESPQPDPRALYWENHAEPYPIDQQHQRHQEQQHRAATRPTRNLDPIDSIHRFNNHTCVLTDRPAAFPRMYSVHLGQGVTFDGLIAYCVTRDPDAQLSTLPLRREWGSVNPVLLMTDACDPRTGKTAYSYVVTSRGYLSELNARPCYNEIFLPNRPVTRLNLDMDMKCCALCRDRYTTNADDDTKRRFSGAMANSMLLMIAEALLSMTNAPSPQIEPGAVDLRELIRNIGKLSVYIRPSTTKNKLSLRMLWYLPMELCSVRGIEAYKPLLREMEMASLRYALLSYPEDLRLCGLCTLSKTLAQQTGSARCLRVTGDAQPKRISAVDRAPYAFRKSVRLPNCCKESTVFEYVHTFNDQVKLPGSGFDNHLCLSVGLSSNPVGQDVTFLGDRFSSILQETQPCMTVAYNSSDAPDFDHVSSEAARLIALWGVPVTVKKTSTGLFCVQATEKSTSYPCPKHNRVHSNCKLSALVFGTQTVYKCFVP